MPQSQYYCPLDECKDWLKTEVAPGNTLSVDDKRLLKASRAVSRRVDNTFAARRPLFQPYSETRLINVSPYLINQWLGTLALPGWLLDFDDTLVTVNGVSVDVEAYPDDAMPPFRQIRLTDCDGDWYAVCGLTCCSAPLQVSVPGIWGFHREGTGGWEAVDTLAAQINAGVTTLTVADVDGADASGMTPRISPGDLLWIDNNAGAPEYLEVISTNLTTNVVTVQRGMNGTSPDGHALAEPVYRWNVEEPVKVAVARQAALMYARRGAYVAAASQGTSEQTYPADWLSEVVATMEEYA
jgi:hypothetical protein